jgi:hypothetical protein
VISEVRLRASAVEDVSRIFCVAHHAANLPLAEPKTRTCQSIVALDSTDLTHADKRSP